MDPTAPQQLAVDQDPDVFIVIGEAVARQHDA
jgi:hypothetical protein